MPKYLNCLVEVSRRNDVAVTQGDNYTSCLWVGAV